MNGVKTFLLVVTDSQGSRVLETYRGPDLTLEEVLPQVHKICTTPYVSKNRIHVVRVYEVGQEADIHIVIDPTLRDDYIPVFYDFNGMEPESTFDPVDSSPA